MNGILVFRYRKGITMAQCGMQRVLPVKEALNEGKCSRPKPFSRNPAAACLLAVEQMIDYKGGTLMVQKRRHPLLFRVNEKELKMIEKKMELLGIRNREAYLRKMAIDGCCVNLDLTAIREMTKLVRSVSNNLNQYARWANESGEVHRKDMEKLMEQFAGIYEAEKQILSQLQVLS